MLKKNCSVDRLSEVKVALDSDNNLPSSVKSSQVDASKNLFVSQYKLLVGHVDKVLDVAWNKESNSIISVAQDGKMIRWDTSSGLKTAISTLNTTWIMSCCWSSDSHLQGAAGLDNVLCFYNLKYNDAPPLRILEGHDGYISACRFPSSHQVVTASGDKTARLWDVNTAHTITVFDKHTGDIFSLDKTVTPQTFTTGSSDNTAKKWDVRTGKCVNSYEVENHDIAGVATHPSETCCLLICNAVKNGFNILDSCQVKLWDFRTQTDILEHSLSPWKYALNSCDWSKSGRLAFFAGRTGRMAQIDLTTLKANDPTIPDEDILPEENPHSALVVSPDGALFALANYDTNVRLYGGKKPEQYLKK